MSITAGKDYVVSVAGAVMVCSSQKGTPGVEIRFECSDGEIAHTLWMTEKTRESVKRDLETLGCTAQQMGNPAFFANIDSYLAGRKCCITTHAEEYNGKTRVKVQWINPESKARAAGKNIAAEAAAILGGRDGDTPF